MNSARQGNGRVGLIGGPQWAGLLRVACLMTLSAMVSLAGGCSGGSLQIDQAVYSGPPMTLTRADELRLIAVEAPTPGWALSIDQVRGRADYAEVFAPLRGPDPAYLYPQMIVTLRTLTGVRTDRAIKVFTRVLEHEATGGAYRLAIEDE